LGFGEVQDVDVSAEVARMVVEPLAPELLLRELEGLDRGAHRTIEDKDAFGEKVLQPVADAACRSHAPSVRAPTRADHESHRLPRSVSPATRSEPPKASCAARASPSDMAREEQPGPTGRMWGPDRDEEQDEEHWA